MKLLEVFNLINEAQFLIERDILNAKELKQWAQQSAERIQHPQAKTWYASQLYKFLINRYEEGARPLNHLGDVPANAPEWLIAKLQAGEPVLNIEPQQDLRRQAEGVIDWLNAQSAENSNLNLRMTWEEAVIEQAEWHNESKRAARVSKLTPEQMEGLVTIREYPDGYKWVDVQTEICLQHEGTMMGHCVGQGGYTQGVSEGLTKIISLRDAKGLAHATIEGTSANPIIITQEMMDQNANQLELFDKAESINLSNMEVNQVKGKENKGVATKYRDYVQDFLTQFRVDNFTDYGLSDLENSGLYKLKKGGFAPVEDVGKKMVDNSDGTSWYRIDGEEVELKDYNSRLHAKWPLMDKSGRGIGYAQEKQRGVVETIQLGYPHDIKHKEHVNNLFSTGLKPGEHVWRSLKTWGLAVGYTNDQVGEPQTVGIHKGDIRAGSLYQTNEAGPTTGPTFGSATNNSYWVMSGDRIISRVTITANNTLHNTVTLKFDTAFGIPNGSMAHFVEDMEKVTKTDIEHIHIRNITMPTEQLGETEAIQKQEKVMEKDDVSYYMGKDNTVHGIDSNGNPIFVMNIAERRFDPLVVTDPKIAGFYAIYIIDDLNEDIGTYQDYNSFTRELADETEWFQSIRNDTWHVMSDEFPINYTETHHYESGRSEVVEETEATMSKYWENTGLDQSGLDSDYFISEYDSLYRGQPLGYDEENHNDDMEENEDAMTQTDYHAEPIGDVDTVSHPVSGGTMRVSR